MRTAAIVTLALASAAVPSLASPPPRVAVDAARRVVIGDLPAILEQEPISRHLESGLTTTFLFRATLGGRDLGAARVDVRYDLWDEVFEVVAVSCDGGGEHRALPGREALGAWWSGLELAVADLGSLPGPAPEGLRLVLEVVPFSASEQDDAQRWFARSFGAPPGGDGGRVTDAAEQRGDSLEKVLGVLMATSIRGTVLYSATWAVAVPGGG